MRPTPKQELRLLAWINRQRAGKVGREGPYRPLGKLPRGIPGDSQQCSLAVALGERAEVISDPPRFRHTPYQEFQPLPNYVAAFDRRFDAREYPALIDDRDPLTRLRAWLVEEARLTNAYPRDRAAILKQVVGRLDSFAALKAGRER
jgi:hypothetical protein